MVSSIKLFRKVLAIVLLIAYFSTTAFAAFILSSNIPTDISSCQELVFDLTLSNPEPSAQAAGTLQYCLPDGIRYAGISGLALLDASDPRCPVFTLPSLPANGSLNFQLRVQVGCFNTDQGDVRDTIRIVSGGVMQPLLLGSAYNVRTPVITLLPGQNWNYTGAAGEVFTRTFILRNEGFGAALYLYVIDSFALAGLELVQTTGVFQGDTLVLSAAELGPNGLGHLDSVLVTQMFRITDCSGQAQVIRYGWGCPDGEICSTPWLDQYQITGGNNPSPVLITSLNAPFSAPIPCEPQQLEILVENTGVAPAFNLECLQGYSLAASSTADGSIKTDCYPITNFQIAGAALTDSSTVNSNLPYHLILAAFTSDPDGPGGLSDEDGDGQFDDLAPGNSFVLQSTINLEPYCKPCNGLISAFFLSSQIKYTSSCAAAQSVDLSPGLPLEVGFEQNEFTEEHDFILDAGTVHNFEYTLDASSPGLLELCPNDSIILEFILPEVLRLPANFQPLFDNVVAPFWTVGDSLLYLLLPALKGDLLLPMLPLCPPDIDDSAICSPPYEPRTYQLPASLRWLCGNGCSDAFQLICISGEHFTIDCPRPEDTTQQHGIFADTLWVQRLSLGFVDNILSAQVAPGTPGLRTDTGIPFDTIRIVGEARFEGALGDIFDSAQLQIYYWNGVQPYLIPLSAALVLDDVETGQSLLCPDVALTYELVNGYHIWELDLLPLLQPGGCLSGGAIQLTPGDRLRLDMQAQLTEAWPYLDVEDIKDLRLRFPYVYHGDSLLCETKNAPFRGINPDFDYTVDLMFPDTVCQDLKLGISFFQGKSGRIVEDLFPNEIRPLCVYDTILVELGPGYAYQPGSSLWEYEAGDGAVGAPVPSQMPLPDPLVGALPGGGQSLLYLRPPALPVTDYYEGHTEAKLSFRAQVLCPPDTTKIPITISGHRLLAILDSVNMQVTPLSIGTPDFNEVLLRTFSPLSNLRVPLWLVEYCNSGPSFVIETPLLFVENGVGLQLLSATDVTNAIPQTLTITTLDSINSVIQGLPLTQNGCRIIEISGTVLECQTDTLRLFPGFQCAAADTPCVFPRPLELYFSPKPAIAQINVSSSPDTAVQLCEPLDYAFKILNVGEGFMYDLQIGLELPPAGQTLVPGSSGIEYNGQLAPLPDPVLGPEGYVWTLDFTQLPFGIDALPSVLFVQANSLVLHFQLETNCDYIDGTRFLYRCLWRDACGEDKQTSPFVAPPLQIQGAPAASNAYQIDLEMDSPASFCAENTLRVRIINPGDLGPTMASENVRIAVSNTFSYVPGSLMGVHNGPTGPPVILPFGAINYLSFDLPAGVVAGDSMVFTFRLLKADTVAGCQTSDDIRVQMTQTANVACKSSFCAIDFMLLEKQFTRVFQKPDFDLSGLSGQSLPLDAGLEEWQLDFEIGNSSNLVGGGALQLEIRLDENQNGQLDAADPLLQSFSVNVEGLLPGAKQVVAQTVDVATAKGCSGLWLMLVDTLCSCTLDSLFVPFVRLENGGGDQLVCVGTSIEVGVSALNGAVYEWIPASPYLNNPQISNPQYLYTGPFDNTFQYSETLVLKTTRAQGCISLDTITLITRKVQLTLSPSPTLCFGDSTGTVQTLVQGADDPVQYAWNSGQGSQLDSLPAGQYSLTVTDANGCTDSASTQVSEPQPLTLDVAISDFNGFGISCAGASDGSLEALASGGVGGYQFTWTPGGSAPVLTNLPAGSYTLTLTDANACTTSVDVLLTEPDSLLLALSVSDEICPNSSNGTISATVQGGVAPYSSGGQTVGSSFDLNGLSAGAYTVLVTDANGCMVALDTALQLLQSTFLTHTDSVSCFGGVDGFAEIAASGFPPFSYAWSGGGTGASINGPAGMYACTVTDALACNYILEMVIEQPEILVLTADTLSVACHGDSTGQISLQGTGGVGGYVFFQNGQPIGPLVGNLPAGVYSFSLEDGNACVAVLDVELEQPAALAQTFTVADARCFDSRTGRVAVQASGGTGPYQVAWSTGSGGAVLDSVASGLYVSTLTDARGCSRMDTAWVGQPAPYVPVFETMERPCFEEKNGVLALSGLPAGTRYRLNQRPWQSDPVFSVVGGGTQFLEIEDTLGCRFDFEYFMVSYPEMLGFLLQDTVLQLGDSAWLRVALAPGFDPGEVQYKWLAPVAPLSDCDTCASLWVRPFQSAYYAVRFSSLAGCESESRVLVQVLRDSVYAPNVIYADALLDENRYFTLYGRSEAIRQVRVLRVFDRWGEAVFERQSFLVNDHMLGWDGTFRAEKLSPGVFVWYAEVEFIDGFVLFLQGDITLLR